MSEKSTAKPASRKTATPKSKKSEAAKDATPTTVVVEGQTYKLAPIVEPSPSTTSVWARLQQPFSLGFLLVLGGLAAFVLGMAISSLATVLIYIALALFLALGLEPLVHLLEKRGMSRPLAIVVVMFGLLIVIGIIVATILPTVISQVTSFIADLPAAINNFLNSELYASLYERFGEHLATLIADVQAFLTDPGNLASFAGGALQVGAGIAGAISGSVIVLVLTIYFVATLPTMKQAMLRFAPARNRENVSGITDQIMSSVGGYVGGMVILALLNAVLVFFAHLFLNLPFPLLMAVFAFLITLIPLVGTLIFWVLGTGLALFTSPTAALIFAIVYIVYMQVEAYVLTPKVMNRTIAIPGALVVIGALVGGTLLGLLGALVAIPVTASLLIIVKQVIWARQDARV